MRNGRHLVYTEERVRALFAKMRSDLHEMAARHAAEVTRLREELDGVRAAFDELRSISRARQQAEAELRELYRERAIARARAVEHDPKAMLN